MAVGPHPLEAVLGAEKRFSAMLELLLNKGGPLGVVKDFVVKSEYQKRGGINWHEVKMSNFTLEIIMGLLYVLNIIIV